MCRVLVVDDQPDFRETLSGLLSDEGYTVRTATNEGEALDAVIEAPFDIALIDVRLHGGGEEDESGSSLAMAFRALNPQIRVVLLTGYVRTKQVVRAIRYLGVVDFIDKNTQDWGRQILKILAEARPRPEPRCEGNDRQPDEYSRYESGLRELLSRFKGGDPRYGDALVYQHRLVENFTRSRRHGDNDTHRSERSEIIAQLNTLALDALGMSYNELCEGSTLAIGREPPGYTRFEEAGGKSTITLSLAPAAPLVVRARGHHICSAYTQKTLQVDVERYATQAELARRDPDNLRFQAEEIGLELWRDVFVEHPEAARIYLEARAESRSLALFFETPREFLRLPLEFLHSPPPADYMILQHPFARFLYGTTPEREGIARMLARLKKKTKLQVLVMVSNTASPGDSVDARALELSRSLEGQEFIPVGVNLIPTEHATYERIRTELEKGRYDIVHYIGHGYPRAELPAESCLYFWAEENKRGPIVPMKGSELKKILESSETRLVYLSCFGPASGAETDLAGDDSLGLAYEVAQAGVPSVVGLRWPVSDQNAHALALAFYHSLFEQGSPEVALWSARCELAARNRDDPTWLSPVLIHQE